MTKIVKCEAYWLFSQNRNRRNRFVYNQDFEGINELITLVTKLATILRMSSMNEKKLKHLEFIQGVINRFGNNSFLIKGWCITIVAALSALSSGTKDQYILIAYFPVLIFWLLDSYYLWQERLFRQLYDEVRIIDEAQIDFSMTFSNHAMKKHKYIDLVFSKTIIPFYSVLVVTVIILMFII